LAAIVCAAFPVATRFPVASTTFVVTVTDFDTPLALRTRVRALTVAALALTDGVVTKVQSTFTGSVTIMLTSRTMPPQTK